jgi:hypothetical protein
MLCHFVMHGPNVDEVQRVNVHFNKVQVHFSNPTLLVYVQVLTFPAQRYNVAKAVPAIWPLPPLQTARTAGWQRALVVRMSVTQNGDASNQKLLRIRRRPRN